MLAPLCDRYPAELDFHVRINLDRDADVELVIPGEPTAYEVINGQFYPVIYVTPNLG